MNTIFYPDKQSVENAKTANEPMMVLIGFSEQKMIVAPLDEAFEHYILLNKVGIGELALDKYFRIIVDQNGADWTFVCPPDYKGIADKTRRISEFYKDGFSAISAALAELGYMVGINIPQRYSRHIKDLK